MKKILLLVLIMLVASPCYAQCVAEITDVKQDEVRGSIIVETEYELNGVVVQLGRVRYDEDSGTNTEIIAKAKIDVETHCKTLIRRIEANKDFLNTEKLKQNNAITQPIIDAIKTDLEGHKETETEYIVNFKGKEIKVTYDEKNTATDISP